MHPNDENVTVISGTFNIAMGEKFDDSKGPGLKTGSFAKAPKGMAHYAWFPEETIIQIHGLGPSGVTYVNPADDPRKQETGGRRRASDPASLGASSLGASSLGASSLGASSLGAPRVDA